MEASPGWTMALMSPETKSSGLPFLNCTSVWVLVGNVGPAIKISWTGDVKDGRNLNLDKMIRMCFIEEKESEGALDLPNRWLCKSPSWKVLIFQANVSLWSEPYTWIQSAIQNILNRENDQFKDKASHWVAIR